MQLHQINDLDGAVEPEAEREDWMQRDIGFDQEDIGAVDIDAGRDAGGIARDQRQHMRFIGYRLHDGTSVTGPCL